jgi:hypothetical protein
MSGRHADGAKSYIQSSHSPAASDARTGEAAISPTTRRAVMNAAPTSDTHVLQRQRTNRLKGPLGTQLTRALDAAGATPATPFAVRS